MNDDIFVRNLGKTREELAKMTSEEIRMLIGINIDNDDCLDVKREIFPSDGSGSILGTLNRVTTASSKTTCNHIDK